MVEALLASLLLALTAYAGDKECAQDSLVRIIQGRCIPLISNEILNQPVSIAFGPDGIMFVASRDNGLILAVSKQGVVKGRWTTDGAPLSLAVDMKGGIIYCSTTKNQVMKYSFQGKLLGKLADLSGARGLARTSRGTLYAAVGDAHVILELSAEGKTVRTIGRLGTAPGEFQFPQRIAVDTKDNLWVAELSGNRIQRIDTVGRAEVILKDIEHPSALSITGSTLWFSSGGRTITKYALESKKSTAVSALENVNDVIVSQSGEIYILLGHPTQK